MGQQKSIYAEQWRVAIETLTLEAIGNIFIFFELHEISTLSLVCRKFNNVIKDDNFWRIVLFRYFRNEKNSSNGLLDSLVNKKYDSWQFEWIERVKEFHICNLHKLKDVEVWGNADYNPDKVCTFANYYLFIGITKPLKGIKDLFVRYRELSNNYQNKMTYYFQNCPLDNFKGSVKSMEKVGAGNFTLKFNPQYADFQRLCYDDYHKYIEKTIKPYKKKKAQGVFFVFDVNSHHSFSKVKDTIDHFPPNKDHCFMLVGIFPDGTEREVRLSKIIRLIRERDEYRLNYFELRCSDIGNVAQRSSRVLSAIGQMRKEVMQVYDMVDEMTRKILRKKMIKKDRTLIKILKKGGIKVK